MGNRQRCDTPLTGIKGAGPFDQGRCPSAPQVLFVFADELRDDANRLFLALKNGLGPFKGCEPWFRFTLSREQVARVPAFSIRGTSDRQAALLYSAAITNHLKAIRTKPDIALILHPKTQRTEQDNIYLYSKHPLLSADVPTQVVTPDLIQQTETFRWSVANIALQMFAKLGGIPWVVETQLEEDCLVIGINRAIVSEPGNIRRVYGFAATFSYHGVYTSTKLFRPANDWDSYLTSLKTSMVDAIAAWRSHVGRSVNLVLHMRKEISKAETDIVSSAIQEAGGDLVKSYAVLKLLHSDRMLLFDPGNEAYTPPSAIMVRLAGHRALLQITGQDPNDNVIGRTSYQPLHVSLLRASANALPFEVLCQHVLALSAMNWRGFNAEAVPVSLEYPRLVAELLGRFSSAGFDPCALASSSVLERPWFL